MQDFKGQELAEFLATALLTIAGVSYPAIYSERPFPGTGLILMQGLAFIFGYFKQDIVLALYIGLSGTALTFLLVVPPWPFYNTHPVKWLPVGGVQKEPQQIVVDGDIVG